MLLFIAFYHCSHWRRWVPLLDHGGCSDLSHARSTLGNVSLHDDRIKLRRIPSLPPSFSHVEVGSECREFRFWETWLSIESGTVAAVAPKLFKASGGCSSWPRVAASFES